MLFQIQINKARRLNVENTMTFRELQDYKCDKCDGSGWLYVKHGDSTVARVCECMNLKANAYNIQKSGLAEVIDRMTFATFRAKEDWQIKLLHKAQEYCDNLLSGGTAWLMICGQIGSGKTHLATAIMRDALFSGFDAKYVLWRDAALGLKRVQLDDEQYSERLESLINPNVLYIDDFFKGAITDADKNVAYDIVNGRYMRNRPMIITCEKTFSEIMAIDEAIGSRIKQMTGDYYIEIGPDVRKNQRMRK